MTKASAPDTGQPLIPIGLGVQCSVKFQICRHFYQRAHPHAGTEPVRHALNQGTAGQVFRRHLFDWQVTPTAAAVEYLERDFQGVFEREDLTTPEAADVEHRWLRTRHPHDFHAVDGVVNGSTVDAQYPQVRQRFEHLAERFRRHLREPGEFLYIHNERPTPELAARLLAGLDTGAAGRSFQLLFADFTPESQALADVDPRISQVVLAAQIDKPPDRSWEGDDAAWEAIFARFPIRLEPDTPFSVNLKPLADPMAAKGRPLHLQWLHLPSRSPAEALPQTFATPPTAWDYGGVSERLDPFITAAAADVLVGMTCRSGVLGVGFATPDGAAIVGREHRVTPEDGSVVLRLPYRQDMGEVTLLLRNYGVEEVSCVARIDWLRLVEGRSA
ncbi:hypothetical protein BH09PSE2_BH09PSE2_19130 [soil metagenome]